MTYYLTRTYRNGTEDKIAYTARNTPEAIRYGLGLHEARAIALYAQIRDHSGRVICTLGTNAGGLGKTKLAYQGEIELQYEQPRQLELWKRNE